jgi:hypothetical protein
MQSLDSAVAFGAYLAIGLYVFYLISPLLVVRFMIKVAEIIKIKYQKQYAQELRQATAKYQALTNDFQNIS